MGASSSIDKSFCIHISVSSHYVDEGHVIRDMISKLKEAGFRITTTNTTKESSTKEICDAIRCADLVIYCNTQNYNTCSTQAIEYSYLSENKITCHHVIVDRYESRVFASHIQRFLNNEGWELSSTQNIVSLVNTINNRVHAC